MQLSRPRWLRFFGMGAVMMCLGVSVCMASPKGSPSKEPWIVDLHVDTLMHLTKRWYDLRQSQRYRSVDIPKLRRSGVHGVVFVLFVRSGLRGESAWRYLQKMLATYQRMLRTYPDTFSHVQTVYELEEARRQGKIGTMLAVEGAHAFGGKLAHVRDFLRWRPLYVGLTWDNSNVFATSARDESRRCPKLWPRFFREGARGPWRRKARHFRRCGDGLTFLGKQLVQILEDAGIWVDLSHAGRQTFWDVMRIARRPVIASHSNAFALCSHYRNLTKRQLVAIKKNGGLVGINFFTRYLESGVPPEKVRMGRIIEHLRYFAKTMGSAHLALGSDYDGGITAPRGLEHVGRLLRLKRALHRTSQERALWRGFWGENVLRLMRAREEMWARPKKEPLPKKPISR